MAWYWEGATLLQSQTSDSLEDESSELSAEEIVAASPAPARKAARLYLPQLDTLRFFAFLSVFFYHGLPSNDVSSHSGHARTVALVESIVRRSGANGVALFFVLSAFLITELLKREKEVSGTIDLKKFYVRRMLRIWPLYYMMVAIGLMIQPLSVGFRLSVTGIVTYLFFVKNWDVGLHGFAWNPIYVLWTVSVEEQFYLVWPLLQRLFSKGKMVAFCVASMLVLPAIAFWPTGGGSASPLRIVFYFTFFPVGGLLSLWLKKREPVGVGRCVALLMSGAGMWLVGTWLTVPDGDHEGPRSWALAANEIILVGTVLIFLAFLRSDPKWSPVVLRYLGKISYGLYVFQIFGLLGAARVMEWLGLLGAAQHSAKELMLEVGVRLPLALGLTMAMAGISYRFFETPFLKLKDRFAVIQSRSV